MNLIPKLFRGDAASEIDRIGATIREETAAIPEDKEELAEEKALRARASLDGKDTAPFDERIRQLEDSIKRRGELVEEATKLRRELVEKKAVEDYEALFNAERDAWAEVAAGLQAVSRKIANAWQTRERRKDAGATIHQRRVNKPSFAAHLVLADPDKMMEVLFREEFGEEAARRIATRPPRFRDLAVHPFYPPHTHAEFLARVKDLRLPQPKNANAENDEADTELTS